MEDMVAGCQWAVVKDIIEPALQADIFNEVILITEHEVNLPEVIVEHGGRPFHFGEKLKQVIDEYKIEIPVYIGGGSIPLLTAEELASVAHRVSAASDTVITNNPFSCDLVAFTPGEAIHAIEPPATDNPLAQLLVSRAGLNEIALPKTAAYQFDVDTPTDLLILKLHLGAGRHTRAYIDELDLDTSRLERGVSLLADVDAQITVAGRVGSYVWSQLERDTSCRVRMLAEERSLNADDRAKRGEVCTILGFYLEQVGVEHFFETLAQLGHAAFIDTRVLFTHLRLELTDADRFNSDLGRHEAIENPFAREFTRGAIEAQIPIILGGHSLVSGGLLALIEIAHINR